MEDLEIEHSLKTNTRRILAPVFNNSMTAKWQDFERLKDNEELYSSTLTKYKNQKDRYHHLINAPYNQLDSVCRVASDECRLNQLKEVLLSGKIAITFNGHIQKSYQSRKAQLEDEARDMVQTAQQANSTAIEKADQRLSDILHKLINNKKLGELTIGERLNYLESQYSQILKELAGYKTIECKPVENQCANSNNNEKFFNLKEQITVNCIIAINLTQSIIDACLERIKRLEDQSNELQKENKAYVNEQNHLIQSQNGIEKK